MNSLPIALAFALLAGNAHAINKCVAKDGKVAYQDAPCGQDAKLTERIGPPSAKEKAIEDTKLRDAETKRSEKLNAEGKAIQDSLDKMRFENTLERGRAAAKEQDEIRQALSKVRVGMTDSDLYKLHPLIQSSGKVRYMDSPYGRSEWRTFEYGPTLHIENGVVTFIHY